MENPWHSSWPNRCNWTQSQVECDHNKPESLQTWLGVVEISGHVKCLFPFSKFIGETRVFPSKCKIILSCILLLSYSSSILDAPEPLSLFLCVTHSVSAHDMFCGIMDKAQIFTTKQPRRWVSPPPVSCWDRQAHAAVSVSHQVGGGRPTSSWGAGHSEILSCTECVQVGRGWTTCSRERLQQRGHLPEPCMFTDRRQGWQVTKWQGHSFLVGFLC